ncbi:MAG: hypothetical protein FIB01_13215, partial [Gemmatimonadetes bacterium]|nr:hypothetical protein [Gemmatimonadota bacterium]
PPGLPDAVARERIVADLDTNLLVEAGAGAGKTTAMVNRMVALVRWGRAEVQQVAAVTFTRKAAAELREKFQTALERALRDPAATEEERTRLDRALRDIDRAFLGTIHAFCARLLRERPLEAGLDPGFRETLGAEAERLRNRFWLSHLERLAAEGDGELARLAELGMRPQDLEKLFQQLVAQPDVRFEAERCERPDASGVRNRIEALVDRAWALMPHLGPEAERDGLQGTVRRLRFHRRLHGWADDVRFLEAIGGLAEGSFKMVQHRWPDGGAAKQVQAEFLELFAGGGPADQLRRRWWAFRYPYALGFAQRAARACERERLRAGTLNFQDLLTFAARLLGGSQAARRELGERYRFLLVDEFQDTDPVQAEVLFLLASEPTTESWRTVVPRPGALFVVGDPKQSIYRFRRADMALYTRVKARFGEFGAVLELVTNFRSGQAVEEFVNQSFRPRFPPAATQAQAGFAPMLVRPRPADYQATQGVFWYELDDPVHSPVDRLALQDAERVATWIRERIDRGERSAGEFLVLTPTTKRLGTYAAALEQRNIPVQVTGAGVGEDGYLRELRLLLRALADPGDPVLGVAVLVGLFFGLDYEQLTQHVEKWAPPGEAPVREPFSFTRAWEAAETDVERALAVLHRFWQWTRAEPADLALERITSDLALVPLAAAGDLGQTRAGAMLFAHAAVRAASSAGDSSIAGALAALDAALDEDESEAPLEPGRTDVVRVMNLHKAKGLEAPVVVLAHPFGEWVREPEWRVVRDAEGDAVGYTRVTTDHQGRPAVVAQPPDWDQHAELEREFLRAENERLLYVAATRAGDELVVGMAASPRSRSLWHSFHDWLRQHGTRLELPPPGDRSRSQLTRPAAAVRAEIETIAQARTAAARPGYRVASVTARKQWSVEAAAPELSAPADAEPLSGSDPELLRARHERGTEWGSIVHEALEAALGGASPDQLRALGRGWLIAAERPTDALGEPTELAELLAVVAAVRASRVWQRALAADVRLTEVPFAVAVSATEWAALAGEATPAADAAPRELIDGRIDLAFRERAGWTIVDYKSDAEGTGIPVALMRRYQSQVRLYGRIWERLTGEPVIERLLLFTAGGLVDVTA